MWWWWLSNVRCFRAAVAYLPGVSRVSACAHTRVYSILCTFEDAKRQCQSTKLLGTFVHHSLPISVHVLPGQIRPCSFTLASKAPKGRAGGLRLVFLPWPQTRSPVAKFNPLQLMTYIARICHSCHDGLACHTQNRAEVRSISVLF
mgnify:CR=1 FL=1